MLDEGLFALCPLFDLSHLMFRLFGRTKYMIIVNFIHTLVTVLTIALLIRVVLGWVNPPWGQQPFRLLLEITEPILAPLRRVIPPLGMFDLSPIVAFVILGFIQQIV